MPTIGNINSSGNLGLPTGLPDPVVSQPTNPVPSQNSGGFSKDIAELKSLFPNAPRFKVGDSRSSYIEKSLTGASIPTSHAEKFDDVKNPRSSGVLNV
jgi:hypothetical protein